MDDPQYTRANTRYDRPNEQWKCSHADGAECFLGPTHRGICQASAECVPRSDGDRWACTRPPLRGGPCDDGPQPDGTCTCFAAKCTPARTVRSRRGVFAFCCLALTLGGLLLALNSNARRDIFAPGALTGKHSQILSGSNVENRCATCHPAGNATTSQWFLSAVTSHGDTQTRLCMECHDKSINPDMAKLAHNVSAAKLGEITSQKEANKIQLVSFSSPTNENGELACAACHREHHGASHDLTFLSNAQCQNCHAEQFDSFEHGHPEFGDWPYARRQRIAFDHVSHLGKHFKKESRELSCNDCHKQGSDKDIVSVTSYSACADCHESKMSVSLSEGVPIFKLPMIDTVAMLDAGFDIGQWPNKATGEFDGTLPEFMKLLLLADDNGRNALNKLGRDFDFYDTEPKNRAQMKLVSDLVWAIKRLLNDLATDADAAWRDRIRIALNRELSPMSLQHLHTSFSTGYFALSTEKWFLDLSKDVSLEFGEKAATTLPAISSPTHSPAYAVSRSTAPKTQAADKKKGWQIDHDRFTISYYPQGHNDTFIASMVDLMATAGSTEGKSDVVDDCRAAFLSATSIGQCVTCHSIDESAGSQSVNWRARHETMSGSGFTRFSHSEHLTQTSLADCRHCHQLNPNADFQSAYAAADLSGISSFHPVSKSSCVECHNQRTNKDACTTCHQYHVHPNSTKQQMNPLIAELIDDLER